MVLEEGEVPGEELAADAAAVDEVGVHGGDVDAATALDGVIGAEAAAAHPRAQQRVEGDDGMVDQTAQLRH